MRFFRIPFFINFFCFNLLILIAIGTLNYFKIQRMQLTQSLLDFLSTLAQNNHREWFNLNKPVFQKELAHFKLFSDELYLKMESFDLLEGKSVFRIYRDVRFSKDKLPYKTHFSVGITRATKWKRGGYYLHIQPGESFIGGGFWDPEPADVKRIRQELAVDTSTINKITQAPDFEKLFGELQGEKLKTAPQSYSKDHENIEWLKFKQYLLIRKFSDEEVLSKQFMDEAVYTFSQMLPFFDYFSDILTTDENGTPLPGY